MVYTKIFDKEEKSFRYVPILKLNTAATVHGNWLLRI